MTDFLRLNNIAVPVQDGGASYGFEEHGSRQRAMDGTIRSTRTSMKRTWRFETPVLDPEQALMIAGLLAGAGHRFSFDADAFDIKGMGPLDPALTQVFTIRTGLDPDPSVQRAEAALKYGGAVAVEIGTTNMLPENVRTGTDFSGNTSGFTEVDGPHTVFASATLTAPPAYQGSKALEITTAVNGVGIRGGVKTNPIAASALTRYSASVLVAPATAVGDPVSGPVRMFLRDVANGIDGPIEQVVPIAGFTGVWARLRSSVTTGALATTLEIHVLEDVADTSIDVYCDAFQIEQQPGPTSWVNGTRANGLLRMDVQSFLSTGRTVPEDVRTANDVTVMCWVNRGNDGFFPASTEIRQVWTITQGFANGYNGHTLGLAISVVNGGAGGTTRVYAGGDESGSVGVTAQFLAGSALGLNTWQHVAVVVRRNSVFGADLNRLKIYADGVLVAQDPWTAGSKLLPNFSKTKRIIIGDAGGGVFPSGAVLDDLVIVPYAMTAAAIAAVAAAGRAFSDLPRLEAEGAAIVTPDPRILVLAELPSGEFIQATMAAHVQNNRVVEFTLTEV